MQIFQISPQFQSELRGMLLLVIANSDEVAGWTEGRPGNVKPAIAGEELVGKGVGL